MGSKRLALLVGCNYANSSEVGELHGCINDVLAMNEVLINRFGFNPQDIQLLTDAPDSRIMPTGAKIKEALNRMTDDVEPGDVLCFHFAGHGLIHNGLEAIVASDFNLITNVDFRSIVNRVVAGASLTIISDSCHSGGLIDNKKEQTGPSGIPTRGDSPTVEGAIITPRTIPYETLLHQLQSMTQIESPDLGTHLVQLFGTDASLSFTMQLGEINSLPRIDEHAGILLSGCQSNEVCKEIRTPDGKTYGVFSNAVETVLNNNPNRDLSNKEIVLMVRDEVRKQGVYTQHACLYCSDAHVNSSFLNQQVPNTK